MDNINHLLTKNGILTSFDICKKFKNSQIKYIKNKLLKNGVPKEKIEDELQKYILYRHADESNLEDIPGIIFNDQPRKIKLDPMVQKKLAITAKTTTGYFKKNKFTKEQIIFFIQAIFLMCGITNNDVEKFKQKYNIDNQTSDDYLDEEDEDNSNLE